MHSTQGIIFARQTQSNPLHFQGLQKNPILALKSKAIMDLKGEKKRVRGRERESRKNLTLVFSLKSAFILPEYHIGKADIRTSALFFYIKFKGFFPHF